MLTNNYAAYRKVFFTRTNADFRAALELDSAVSNRSYSDLTSANIDSPEKSWTKWRTGFGTSWNSYNGGSGVCFGSGTTPATKDDYILESILDSQSLGVTLPSAVTYNQTDEYDEYTATYGVMAKTDVTIGEMGLVWQIYYQYGSTNNFYHFALMDRTVLDEPISIPAGESKQIVYTIRFPHPTA